MIYQIISPTVYCNLELFTEQAAVLWATAVLSCEQKLFSQKKWHFEKSLHFPPHRLQKKVLSQDSLMEDKIYKLSLKNKKKSFSFRNWGVGKEEGVKCVEMFMEQHIHFILSVGISFSLHCTEQQEKRSKSKLKRSQPTHHLWSFHSEQRKVKVLPEKDSRGEAHFIPSGNLSFLINCRHLGSPWTTNFGI